MLKRLLFGLIATLFAFGGVAQVTDRLSGLSTSVAVKPPVKVVTNAAITLSGEQTINGVAVVEGNRVLVKDQTDASANGIYVVDTTAWARAQDFDGARDVVDGTLVVSNNDTSIYYRLTSDDPITIGTSNITFEIISGAVTQSSIGATLYPRTAAEISAGKTPAFYFYPEGNPRRYGATGDGVADDTTEVLDALAVIKASYVHANLTSHVWNLNPGDQYLVTSPIHFGSTTTTGGRVKFFQGNGAKFICNLTVVCVDMTNADSGVYHDLWVTNGTSIPKILVLLSRFAESTAQGMRNTFYRLRVEGRASIAGVFNFGSETNTFFHPQIDMDTDTPYSLVISDTGRYWGGAAYVDVVPNIPNMAAGDHVLPGASTTNNHFFGAWINNRSAYASGGRGAIQLVGGGRHTFHGLFVSINDSLMRPVTSIHDNAVGGSAVLQVSVFGFNPHNGNDIAWEHIAGTIDAPEIHSTVTAGATTADFQLTAGTLTDAYLELQKIKILGSANGNNQFYVGESIEFAGICEGDVYLAEAGTITLSSNNATKRCRVHDSDSGRIYLGADVRDFSSVASSGTGEDNLNSYSITGSTAFMGQANQRMRVRAAGTKTNANGNKTIKFYLGATSWTVFPAANDVLSWAIEAEIYTTASNAQQILLKGYQNNTLVYAQPVTAAIDLTATATMKVTGECANASDVITQTLWEVEKN